MQPEPDFERSADMRLVELKFAALGIPQRRTATWESPLGVEGEPVEGYEEQRLAGALIAAELAAVPAGGVIPGAVVTVSLSVSNEGVEQARGVRVWVPLPGGAAFRNGSFVRDGQPLLDDAADELFERGTEIESIPPKTRVTFVWKIGVRLGNKPLVIAPNLAAERGAIVGARQLTIERAPVGPAPEPIPAAKIASAPSADLPIYELDEEETLAYEVAETAISEYRPPLEPPSQPIPPPAQPGEPLPPPDQPAPVPEPGVPDPEPSNPPPPDMPPDVEPAARTELVLYGRIDRPSIAYFERIFTGQQPPSLVNHFILGGALACTRSSDGSEVAGLHEHVQAQAQLLQRILLHEKIGKKEPIDQYAGRLLVRCEELTPAGSPLDCASTATQSGAIALTAALESPSLNLLRKMQDERWDFVKARQLTLALQARTVAGVPRNERTDAAERALRAYAQTSTTQVQRFFVRMRIDRTTGVLFANDEVLDAAARTLIANLTSLF